MCKYTKEVIKKIIIFVKIKVMKIVIETDEQYRNMFLEIANSIKAKISFNEEVDFSDNLPEHVIKGITESRNQITSGEFLSHEEVMKKYLAKYQ